jgi:hypothetical protein
VQQNSPVSFSQITNTGAEYDTGNQAIALTGTQDDYPLTGTTRVLTVTSASALTLDGLKCSSGADCGSGDNHRRVTIINSTANPTILAYAAIGTGATDRFLLGNSANRTVPAHGACDVVYEFSGSDGSGWHDEHCGLRADCAVGDRLEWDGGAWQCRSLSDYRSKHVECATDFFVVANQTCLLSAATGTGAADNGVSTTTRPFLADMATGTTNTGNVRHSLSRSDAIDFASYSSAQSDWIGGWPTLSTVGEEYSSVIGFLDTVTAANQSNGCFFAYDRLPVMTAPGTGTITAGSANLQCWCASGGTRTGYTMDGAIVSQESFTTVATPASAVTLPDTGMMHLRIVVTGTTRAEFYADTGAGLTKRCDINTNIPSGSNRTGFGFNITKSAGTTARDEYVDYSRISLDMLAARNP